MHNLQSIDAYYAKANIYRRKNGTNFGIYTITENIPTILANIAKILYQNANLKVADWNICFIVENEMRIAISYNDFLNNTKDKKEYDSEHFVITLNKEKIEKLINNYKIEL